MDERAERPEAGGTSMSDDLFALTVFGALTAAFVAVVFLERRRG